MNHLFIYIVITFFHFLASSATGAAAPGCSDYVNAADQVGLLGFHNAVCVVMETPCLCDLARLNFECMPSLP